MYYTVPRQRSTGNLLPLLRANCALNRSFTDVARTAPDTKTLLIVDDSPLIIERLRAMLDGILPPAQIRHAGSYVEALSLILVRVPDILLLDINLPDKSGIELLRLVRNRYQEVAVIMITNQSDPSYRAACNALGALRFLDKSSEFESIPDLIASMV